MPVNSEKGIHPSVHYGNIHLILYIIHCTLYTLHYTFYTI